MKNHDKPYEYYSTPKTAIEPILPVRLGAVLEIGCGTGATMAWVRTMRPTEYAVGVEIVPSIADKARCVFDEVVSGDVETWLLQQDRKFDTVIALDVLEHLVDPWSVVRTIAKCLRNDGIILASIPNAAHWSLAFNLFIHGRWQYQEEGILDKTHLRFFTEDSARTLFEDALLSVEQFKSVKSYPGKTPAQRWYAEKYLRRLMPAHLMNFQFLISARKHKPEAV